MSLKGGQAPLYRGGGLHLRLPSKPHDTIYVYIRKNGCSAFRQWLAAEHGADGTQRNLSIGKLTKRVKVTNEDQIDTSCRVLVLRDPAARLCSLFRNKLIQRSGAEDILANIQALTGLSVDKLTFRQFVEVYVGRHLHDRQQSELAKIDPHCSTQYSHLWPILYDRVIMLQDLPKAALVLFGHDIATKYFCEPANASSKSLVRQTSADVPSHELRALYLESNSLPSDDSFVDSDLRNAIREIYSSDYKMIASVWPEGNQYAHSYGDRYSARNCETPFEQNK
jgi:Sulfotransferase family